MLFFEKEYKPPSSVYFPNFKEINYPPIIQKSTSAPQAIEKEIFGIILQQDMRMKLMIEMFINKSFKIDLYVCFKVI